MATPLQRLAQAAQPPRPPSPARAHPPVFRRVQLGRCHRQTATERFGVGTRAAVRDRERQLYGQPLIGDEMPFTWPGLHPDEPSDTGKSIYNRVPALQPHRNNLTVLSQTQNLYLAAYQGRIFVYQPRTVPAQVLPSEPDFQLMPGQSVYGEKVGGYQDPRHPHSINHLVTGFLGVEEVLVASYDDGDVVAYYIRDVVAAMGDKANQQGPSFSERRPHRCTFRNGQPVPFLHENVGLSAWGLAVHRKSRLIAVSSNRREVTIFAFALARDEEGWKENPAAKDDIDVGIRVRMRARNWRIMVYFGQEAKNVPNICFCDDERGDAEKLCAVDIDGIVWIADIYKMKQPPAMIRPSRSSEMIRSEEHYPEQSRGWGIAVLPDSSFMPVNTVEELFGTCAENLIGKRPTPTVRRPMVLIQKGLQEIPDDPCHAARARAIHGRTWGTSAPDMLPTLPPVLFFPPLTEDMVAVNDPEVWNDDLEMESDDDLSGLDAAEAEEFEQQLAQELGIMMEGDDEVASDDADEDPGDGAAAVEQDQGGYTGQQGQIPHTTATEVAGVANALETPTPPVLPSSGLPVPQGNSPPIGNFQAPIAPINSDAPESSLYYIMIQSVNPNQHHSHYGRTKKEKRARNPAIAQAKKEEELLCDSWPGVHDMVFWPHTGVVGRVPQRKMRMWSFLKRSVEFNTIPQPAHRLTGRSRFQLLRTYEKDLELLQLSADQQSDPQDVSTMCSDATIFGNHRDRDTRHHFSGTSRLNMIHHIPELSLMIVGSPTGRVLLVTLTRLKQEQKYEEVRGYWDHGFRVDWVLPLKSDEEAHRKEVRPLYGLAVGPVQTANGVGVHSDGEGIALPRRYRLMLHYRTHDILTYEITREEQTGRLCIF